MTTVICRPQNAVSAVKLGYPTRQQFFRTDEPVINWGRGDGIQRVGAILNPPQVIARTINKPGFLTEMRGRDGINTPELVTGGLIRQYKWVVRPNEHAEGNDFQIVSASSARPYQVPTGHHATRFIEPTREYRVWFFKDNEYLTAKRVPRSSEGQTGDEPCRSSYGYRFTENFDGALQMVRRMRAIIPIDFGAVDMLWQTDARMWYILEVNSAPSLDHSEVLNFFKSNIDRWVNGQQPAMQDNTRALARELDEETPEDRGESNVYNQRPSRSVARPASRRTLTILTRDGWVNIEGDFIVSNA